ncbi:hypothetical protein ABK040_000779 [Willaertia magna]
MKLHELPFEIISEIVEYIPVRNILNFLLISKDFYQFIKYDEFWKCLLKNYLKSEIKYCKENLNELLLNKDELQEYLNIYSIENVEKINKNKNYYLNKLNTKNLLSITINMKLLQQFVEFYKNKVIKLLNSKFLTENNENIIFSKRFMCLLQQSIKFKCSILINCLADDIPIEFEYLFLELFLNENDNITMIDMDKKFNFYKNNKRKNQEFILNLLKDIKIKFNLQNFIYKNFVSKLTLFIEPIIYSLLINYSHDINFRDKTLQNILQLLQKYNLTISLNYLLNYCNVDLFNISKEFFEYSLITMKDKLFKGPIDYELITKLFEYVIGEDTVIDDSFCNKLNYLMELIFTENCDKQKLIWWLTDSFIIYKKLINLLTCEEDSSKEIYNLFKSLQFFKYNDLKLPLNNRFFSLQFNLNNFKYLINLNLISNEDLLSLFHKYLISSFHSFNFIFDKNFTKNQFFLYLNYFINELNFDIYSKDKFGNNIIVNSLYNCNFYTIINPIKKCCNLQQIDYNKITFNNLQNIIQRQLTTHFEDEKLYETSEIKEIKLNSMKEILKIKEINYSHLFTFSLTADYYNSKEYIYLIPSLQYLISNIKLKDNFEITFEEYVKKEILERKERVKELEELLILEKDNITKNRIDFDNDLIIYFVYKKIQQLISQLEQH